MGVMETNALRILQKYLGNTNRNKFDHSIRVSRSMYYTC